MKEFKTAIVCDWLTSIGGAERVVLALHEMYPDAPIYTSQYDPAKIDWFLSADVRTTWLQKLPKNNTFRKFLPVLRRFAFEHLDLTEYDLIISSSGAEAKAVKKLKPGAVHVTYCHSPTHYYWSRYDEYLKNPGFGWLNPLARLGLKVLAGPMRRWDYKVAQRPDYFIANSTHIKNKIKEYYGRDAIVIHPPVDVERFNKAQGYRLQVIGNSGTTERAENVMPDSIRHPVKTMDSGSEAGMTTEGFVIAGRQVPYKRFDLAVEACTKLNLPLAVIGDGPEHDKLIKIAGPTISFITDVKDNEMTEYFATVQAFIFPGIEDFGIAPVEAMAAGTPIIAYKAGGALDYVNQKTGMFFDSQTVDSLAKTLQPFNHEKFDSKTITKQAELFDKKHFINGMTFFIDKIISKN